MKKIKMILLLMLISIFAYSQSSSYRITKTTILSYDEYWRKWEAIDSTYPSEMFAFFDKKKIKITDRNHSNYVVYGQPEVDKEYDYTVYTWKAIDEEQRECSILLKRFVDENKYYYDKSYLFVMYPKTAFLYLIESDK
jgi:hypothetical protein